MSSTLRKTVLTSVLCLVGFFALTVFTLSTGAADAFGQETPGAGAAGGAGNSGKPTKRTSINFEDQLVEGQTQKPELFYLLQQRNNSYKRLIRLRENFLPEMRKTAEDISR
jgi:hypothetical protein